MNSESTEKEPQKDLISTNYNEFIFTALTSQDFNKDISRRRKRIRKRWYNESMLTSQLKWDLVFELLLGIFDKAEAKEKQRQRIRQQAKEEYEHNKAHWGNYTVDQIADCLLV